MGKVRRVTLFVLLGVLVTGIIAITLMIVLNSDKKYDVTLEFNLESLPAKHLQVNKDDCIDLPGEFDVPGYVFSGWFRDSDYQQKFDDKTPINQSVTLYAKWSKQWFQVEIHNRDNMARGKIILEYGQALKDADGFDRIMVQLGEPGYKIKGFVVDDDLQTALEETMPISSLAYFAGSKQVENQIKVFPNYQKLHLVQFISHYENEEPVYIDEYRQEIEDKGLVKAPPNPTTRIDEGYVFSGWYTNQAYTGGVFDFANALVTSGQVLYAKWELNTTGLYTAQFELNGGTLAGQRTLKVEQPVGDTLAQPANPVRGGYIFEGWYANEFFVGGVFDFTTKIYHNIKLFAKWTPSNSNIVTIRLYTDTNDQGYNNDIFDEIKISAGTQLTVPVTPYKANHVFVGWYKLDNGEMASQEFDFQTVIKGNIELAAKYVDDNSFFVHYNLNGGTLKGYDNYIRAINNGIVVAPANPQKHGYTFAGWYQHSGLVGSSFDFRTSVVGRDLYLFAKWLPTGVASYNIEFVLEGGNIAGKYEHSAVVKPGARVPLPANPIKTGYSFEGWYVLPDYKGGVYSFADYVVADMRLYARWNPLSDKTISITFLFGEGSLDGLKQITRKVNEGDKIFAPQPIATNKSVAKWVLNGAQGDGFDFDQDVLIGDPNQTLDAIWIENPYLRVVFDYNDDSTPPFVREKVYEGELIALPPLPISERDVSFSGWYTAKEGGHLYDFNKPVSDTGELKLYARWQSGQYIVRYYIYEGYVEESLVPIDDNGQAYIELPLNPERDGFYFGGWYLDAEYEGEIFNFGDNIDGDLTLYAKWIKASDKVKVEFHLNGGKIGDNESYVVFVGIETPVDMPPQPIRVGYNFVGWYDNAAFEGEVFGFGDVITADMNLFARWSTATPETELVEVNFELNGGILGGLETYSRLVERGESIVPPANPVKAGYEFAGWFADDALTQRFDMTAIILEDITVYAKWEESEVCTVVFVLNGGSIGGVNDFSTQVNYGSRVVLPPNPLKEGYVFSGWYTNEQFVGGVYDITTVVTESFQLYAKWSEEVAQAYTVNFVLNGGNIAGSTTYQAVSSEQNRYMVSEPQAVRDGYEFGGWYINPYFGGAEFDFGRKVNTDLILYAKWIKIEPIQITVKFILNGGTIGGNTNYSVVLYKDSVLVTPPIPNKNGYIFVGWYVDSDLLIEYSGFGQSVDADFELYAKYQEERTNTHTVFYILNGGKIGNLTSYSLIVNDGDRAPTPMPIRNGYVLMGWKDAFTGENYIFDNSIVKADLYLLADWQSEEQKPIMTVKLDTCGGYLVDFDNVIAIEYGGQVSELPENNQILREGYKFEGWYYYNSNGAERIFYPEVEVITSNRVLYAKWRIEVYTVEFVSGLTPERSHSMQVEFSKKITLESFGFERVGYVLKGWKIIEGDSGTYDIGDIKEVRSNMKLEAIWEINVYTVTFESDMEGVQLPEPRKYEHGESAVTIPLPQMVEGYIFEGWYYSTPNGNEIRFYPEDERITSDMILRAKWSIEVYTVEFVGGLTPERIHSMQVEFSKKITLESFGFERVGHVLKGWKIIEGDNGTYDIGDIKEVRSNIKLEAIWEINVYTVTFESDMEGVQLPEPRKYEHGESAVTIPLPQRVEGYIFEGWYYSTPNGNEIRFYPEDELITSDMILRAKWRIEVYTVEFVSGLTPERIHSMQVEFSKKITLESFEFVRTGHVLKGWKIIEGDSGTYDIGDIKEVRSNMKLQAIWEINVYTVTFESDMEGVQLPEPRKYEHGESAITIPLPQRVEGYIFEGWYYSTPNGNEIKFYPEEERITSNMILRAKWRIEVYTVEFVGGLTPERIHSMQVEFSKKITLESFGFERVGHVLKGWKMIEGDSGTYDIGDIKEVRSNMKLEAIWVANTYSITFASELGGMQLPEPRSYIYGQEIGALPSPQEFVGYRFMGWWDDSTSRYFDADKYNFTRNITLNAVWLKLNKLELFDSADGKLITTVWAANSENPIMPEVPTKTGKSFDGWYTAKVGGTPFDFDRSLSKDMVAYARWVDFLSNLTSDGKGVVIAGHSSSNISSLVIPKTINFLPVKEIGYRAFFRRTDIVEVVLHDDIEVINAEAFYMAWGLTRINFPASIKLIGASAFYECKFTDISLVGNNLHTLGDSAFGYTKFSKITLPDSIRTLGNGVFGGNTDIESINIPDFLIDVGGKNPFGNMSKLKQITIKNNSNFRLQNNNILEQKDGAGVFSILVYFPMSLSTNYTMPSHIKQVNTQAFFVNNNFGTLVLQEGLEIIKSGAFSQSGIMGTITIPASVREMGDSVFYQNNLNRIDVASGNKYFSSFAGGLYTKDYSTLLAYAYKYIEGSGGIYRLHTKTKSLEVTTWLGVNTQRYMICDNESTPYASQTRGAHLATIDGVLFTLDTDGQLHYLLSYPKNKTDKNYDIPEGVKGIGTYGFAYNVYLQKVNIPSSVTHINGSFEYSNGSVASGYLDFVINSKGKVISFSGYYSAGRNPGARTRILLPDAETYYMYYDNEAWGKETNRREKLMLIDGSKP